ncbi:copper chaperone PCu(A)C [Hwanghaeella grinnelliae]|uniref:Copper chaperone PCu(A)C n=1 Tax=Hwanghaeella grinnelliae TaxID=2500179 RepID=A0A437QQ10_9PROT|nr:copper chaperone PCu(A)C [Hwanghaeella grinnelliae]RVU36604.1 copper chaperone PCu(A)C [Hwanghaeella grinnelliae]
MNTILKAAAAALFTIMSIAAAPIAAQAMEPVTSGDLTIEPGWARASATDHAKAGAAFFVIHNKGDSDDVLIGADSGVGGKTEVHTHKHENGVMKMMPAGDVTVPAGGMVMMKPGGLHVMLMSLHGPLKEGEHFQVKLNFSKTGEVTVPVTVMGVAAKGPGGDGHGHMQHGKTTTE